MPENRYDLHDQSDDGLLTRLRELIQVNNTTTAELLANLAEIDDRKLYAAKGFSSLFTYAISLGLSESRTYKYIQVARLARRLPVIFKVVHEGEIHLSGLVVLAPHLTQANHVELLSTALHKSKRQIEELVAAHFPKADAPPRLRKLPSPPSAAHRTDATVDSATAPLLTRAAASDQAATPEAAAQDALAKANAGSGQSLSNKPAAFSPQSVASATPLSAERFKLQVTLSRRARDLLVQAQALMRHRLPDGGFSEICEEALAVLVEKLEKGKFAKRRDGAGGEERPRLRDSNGSSATAGVSSRVAARSNDTSGATASTSKPRGSEASPGKASRRGAAGAVQESLGSRYIAAEVKRAVAERDGYRCSFVSTDGHRCCEQAWLEFHHLVPFARGGRSTAQNVTLRCRCHNAYEAELDYGAAWMARRVRTNTSQTESAREAGVLYGIAVPLSPT